MLRTVDHVNIVVSDIERSIVFYTRLLGFRLTKRARLQGRWISEVVGLHDVVADVAYLEGTAGPRIELLEYHRPAGVPRAEPGLANTIGLRHLAFCVDDIDAMRERLTAEGVDVLGPPVAVPESVVTHEAGRKRLFYFRDPDGVLLELAEYR